jgi:hypothetical protein
MNRITQSIMPPEIVLGYRGTRHCSAHNIAPIDEIVSEESQTITRNRRAQRKRRSPKQRRFHGRLSGWFPS